MTCAMVCAGILDVDHSMNNIVVTSAGTVVRIDLERAKRYVFATKQRRVYALMLAKLIATYAFALQPETSRVQSLCLRLADALSPSHSVLTQVEGYVAAMLETQRRVRGIDTRLVFPW